MSNASGDVESLAEQLAEEQLRSEDFRSLLLEWLKVHEGTRGNAGELAQRTRLATLLR